MVKPILLLESAVVLCTYLSLVFFAGLATVATVNPRARWTAAEVAAVGLIVIFVSAILASFFGGVGHGPLGWLTLGLLVLAVARLRHLQETWKTVYRHTSFAGLLICCAAAPVVAANALNLALCYDVGLYHFNGVRWAAEYGSVPGLANLYTRLGFNTAMFPFAAFLSWPFPVEISRQFANSVVLLVLAANISQSFGTQDDRKVAKSTAWLSLLLLPKVIAQSLSNCLSSPNPDFAATAVVLLSACFFWRVCSSDSKDLERKDFILPVVCAGVSAQLKLSYAAFAAGVFAVVMWKALKRGGNRASTEESNNLRSVAHGSDGFGLIATVLLTCAILFLPWLWRGYLTSGYPFFPSTVGKLPFDWTVPEPTARDERDWVYGWARLPFVPYNEVLGHREWIGPWLRALSHNPIFIESAVLFTVSVFAVLLAVKRGLKPAAFAETGLFSVPLAFSLPFWFFTAPDPRFNEGVLWLVGVAIALTALRSADAKGPAWICGCMIAGLSVYALVAGLPELRQKNKSLPNYLRPSEMIQVQTNSGLKVWIPKKTNDIYDAPLPATDANRFDPRLELRGQGLQEGFRIRGPGEAPWLIRPSNSPIKE
ncbi:MAG: hypothetical protein JO077_15515 [Verrucomicrobia bacterium]|nr:hypothetical protein [Verrucomicrobiota bacterium]